MNRRMCVSGSLGWAGESGASTGHTFNSHRFPMHFPQLGGAQKPLSEGSLLRGEQFLSVRNEEGLIPLL